MCVVVVSMLLMLRLVRDPPSMWFPIIGTVDDATRGLATVSNPLLPMAATLLLSIAMSSYCFTVYQLTIDTILLCFCEELKVHEEGEGYFMSAELLYYVDKQARANLDREEYEEERAELERPKLVHQSTLRQMQSKEEMKQDAKRKAKRITASVWAGGKKKGKKMVERQLSAGGSGQIEHI
jgi:hypothetical protein